MTSTSITGDGSAAIEKTIRISKIPILQGSSGGDDNGDWMFVFEIQRCIDWIIQNSFQRICLQFPDEYITFSPKIVETLEKSTGKRCFILGDSTYGSCCVDEKTAQHVTDADSLIHFGQSCLTACSERLPVLYIFTKTTIDLDKITFLFMQHFSPNENIVILYDVIYENSTRLLFNGLKEKYPSLKLSDLKIPCSKAQDSQQTSEEVIKHGRIIPITNGVEVEDYKIFFIGSRALPNLLLALPKNSFKVYDPALSDLNSISTQTSSINKLIKKRNFYIEKLKDANSVGILVGTLVVNNYLAVIERLKTILKKVGKKSYVVSIGEINPCKLGNFMDIECFVFVGCPEVVNYYLSDDSKGQFFQPILTPYDVELAFCSDENNESLFGQDYVIDWTFLIEKGPPNVNNMVEDVSLITGGLRHYTIGSSEDNVSNSNQVVNWLGLDENEESLSIDPSQIHQGRSGIASSYIDEPIVK